jgi:hypothetical protein
MAAHFTQANQEVHSYMLTDIPDSLKSNSNPQAIKSRNRIFQVSSTSQSQNSGGVLLFNIAPSNFSITKGSMALRARITFTGTNLNAGAATASIGLDGPGGLAATSVIPTLGNGYACMQRMTLYGSNSSIVAQHNFLNDEMNFMLMHNSNSTYLGTDAGLLLGLGAQPVTTSSTSAFIDVVLPVPLSIFQSAVQDFPAYLLSAPLTLQIDLASVARTVCVQGTATCSEYSVSNTFLLFQAVELPSALIEAERMAVKSSPYIMASTSTLAVQVPQSILTSYTLGLNASSIRGVALLPTNAASNSVSTQIEYVRHCGDGAGGAGSGVNAQVYFDGNLINSNIVDNVANTFYMLKQMLHHNVQGNILQPSPISQVVTATAANMGPGNNTFCKNYYSIAFDCTSFDQESTIFGGLPATNVNIQLAGYNDNPTFLVTVLIFYDVLVAFQNDGAMSVKR